MAKPIWMNCFGKNVINVDLQTHYILIQEIKSTFYAFRCCLKIFLETAVFSKPML
jgi:hypothetical protein